MGNFSPFQVLEAKSALLGRKWDLGAPGAKLVMNVRFWELFGGPEAEKLILGAENRKNAIFLDIPQKIDFWSEK